MNKTNKELAIALRIVADWIENPPQKAPYYGMDVADVECPNCNTDLSCHAAILFAFAMRKEADELEKEGEVKS